MRIGVDIRGILTGQHSGIEQYTMRMLENLLKIDQQNTYVLFYVAYRNLDNVFQQLTMTHPFLRQNNVEVKTLKWINLPLLLHAVWKPLNWPKVDKICGGLDVIWLPSPRLLPVSQKCRVVITFHDLVFDLFPQFYTRASRLWQWQMSYPYLARTADKLIAVSHNTKLDLMRLYHIPKDKIEVVYEGVDANYFVAPSATEVSAAKSKFDLPVDYLYYVGSLEPRKNLLAAVRTLAYLHHKSHQFGKIKLVISSGKNWLSQPLFAEIEKLGLKDSVIFTGPVSEAEKVALLANACLFIFPSLYEGFGLPILEAMAAGTPVITSNNSALPEVVGEAGILVNPLDQSKINLAVENIITNQQLAQDLISRGKVQASKFSWERSAKATLNILLWGH